MADYNLEAKITADASGYEAGVKKAEKASKKLSTSVSKVIQGLGKNGLVGALGAVGLASSGLSATLGSVVKVARKVSETINECTNAYKNQLIAERALDTAIQNNPFVTGESSKALKQFASEMQKVSNYGDEQLIPMMTNLISLGRTESETMQIMSVAMDMSAGMGISLDTAINQLNATLNGNIGRLGQQNAELKGLTEEELKQGKAIEILGEKFKGLSGATADTSKQLQNIKGDFKEALGQFTLPSSDMWNKFWAGFYTRGIEAINKINAFMDSQIIGKKLANSITEQIARINPADVGGRVDYTRSVLKVIGDNELEALKNYLSGLKKLSAEQEIILKRIKAEEDSRYQSSINAKKEAEAKKEQADKEAQITAELQKQEELNKKKTDWASKLLDQRIEMLEAEKDRVIQNAEEQGEKTYSIWRDYNEKILELKLERLEKEKEKALAEEGLTAEDKITIEEYYSGETKKIYNDLGQFKRKKNEEENKDEKSKFEQIIGMVKQYAENVKRVFSKIANTIKNVLSSVGNIFTKLFAFNPDEALNSLLKFEDSVLTFFVETLPRLPEFFKTAIDSIIHTIGQVLSVIDFDIISDVLAQVISSIGTLLTSIAKYINQNGGRFAEGLSKLVSTIIQTFANWIMSGGWKELLNALLTVQMALEKVVTDNINDFADTIIAMLPDLIDTLIASIVSASQTLGKLFKPILKIFVKLIEAIIEIAFSDEVLDASMGALEDFVEAFIEVIIQVLPKILPRLVMKLIKVSIRTLASFPIEIAKAFIKGLSKAFANTNWGQAIWDMFQGFIDAFKDLFGIHSPSTVFEGFGKNMIEGLWLGIKEMGDWLFSNVSNLFNNMWNADIWNNLVSNATWAWNKIKEGFEWAGNGIKNTFNGLANTVRSVFENIGSGIKWAINGVIDTVNGAINGINSVSQYVGIRLPTIQKLATGTNNARKGLTLVGEAGPELVYFNGGEQVLNNRNTNKALAEAGKSTNNFNVTFNNLQDTTAYAMMQQLKQYNRQMAINGVI